jgi:hypothetical protein
VALNVCEYEVPATPAGNDAVVIETAAPTESSKAFSVLCVGLLASVARRVKLEVPAVDGCPLSVPALDKVKPAGRFPDATDQI